MHRRQFVKMLACASGVYGLQLNHKALATTSYAGKLLITIQCVGGWDVTSLCDPKVNVAGQREINHWSNTSETRKAGNINYAPFGNNQAFFEKYYQRILVINGIDSQTNAHEAGRTTNWSGRTSAGYPSVTAIHAVTNAPDAPLSYLNFGGFGEAENLIRSTKISSPTKLRNIIYPNTTEADPTKNLVAPSTWDLVRTAQLNTMAIQTAQTANVAAANIRNRQAYFDSFANAESIQEFGNLLPPDASLQQPRATAANTNSSLQLQAQIALVAFKSGVSVSADLIDNGFDTHSFHDRDHEPVIANTMDAIDYLWTYAEELGLADRLVVVVGSDFGRTPYYNSGDGKDHWPIGSYMIMEKNAPYTNYVYGLTDEGHNAQLINPSTLLPDQNNGILIYTKHVHKALRMYLGLEGSAAALKFPFNNTEDFQFFS